MEFYSEMDAEMGIGFLIFYLIYILVMLAFGIAAYVLRSAGVYTIAKRRGIKHAWFSWVPVVDYYLLGCISDQFQYVAKGKVRNKRKSLLALSIILWVIYAVFFGCFFAMFGKALESAFIGYGMSEDELMYSMMGPMIGMFASMIPMMGVAIAVIVVRYMALYDLYTSCSPQNNVLFLVLSIIFSVTEPFFIFFNRKKDGGMPARRPEPQTYIPPQPQYQPAYQPVDEIPQPKVEQDPWEKPDIE